MFVPVDSALPDAHRDNIILASKHTTARDAASCLSRSNCFQWTSVMDGWTDRQTNNNFSIMIYTSTVVVMGD